MENVQVNFLHGQKRKLFETMQDKQFRTLRELENLTGILQTSISSNLRVLKSRTEHVQEINKRKNREGLFEYQLVPYEGHS
tara:strand:+ start:1266 stop:1508 length:243 start_codon:yes stop_codon:yes gene_type:complete